MPVFDPAVDTWDSLRARSSFCITAILMAGQIAAAATEASLETWITPAEAGADSALHAKLVEHAERIGECHT